MKKMFKFSFALFFLLLATFLTFNRQIKDISIALNTRKELNYITSLSEKDIETNQRSNTPDNFKFKQVNSISWESVLSSSFSEDIVLGELAIPSIELNLPIYQGLSNKVLSKGAGTMKVEQRMGEGNYALAGHDMRQSGTLFSDLHKLTEQKYIYITDLKNIYSYEVRFTNVDLSSNVESIRDHDATELTLITCAEEGKKRLIIYCDYINSVKFDQKYWSSLK